MKKVESHSRVNVKIVFGNDREIENKMLMRVKMVEWVRFLHIFANQ